MTNGSKIFFVVKEANIMNIKRMLILISLIAVMALATGTVFAASTPKDLPKGQYGDTAGNIFFGGEENTVEGGLFFGGYGAGKDVSVRNSESEDSLALAGLNLKVEGTKTGGSAYLAARTIEIKKSKIYGNIMAAGQIITVDEKTSSNSAYLTCQEANFNGKARALGISADTVVIDGVVRGDANVDANNVIIGSNAVITGTLSVTSPKKPVVQDGARIGKLDFEKVEGEAAPTMGERFLGSITGALYWAAAMILLGLLLFLIGRHHMERAGELVRTRPGKMLGSGAVGMIAIPIAAIVCLITIIGIPAAIFTGLVYTLTILVSTAFAGASIGPMVFKKMRALPASLLGILILELVEAIPILGGLVQLAAFIFTLGYLLQLIYLGRIKKDPEKMNSFVIGPTPTEPDAAEQTAPDNTGTPQITTNTDVQ